MYQRLIKSYFTETYWIHTEILMQKIDLPKQADLDKILKIIQKRFWREQIYLWLKQI